MPLVPVPAGIAEHRERNHHRPQQNLDHDIHDIHEALSSKRRAVFSQQSRLPALLSAEIFNELLRPDSSPGPIHPAPCSLDHNTVSGNDPPRLSVLYLGDHNGIEVLGSIDAAQCPARASCTVRLHFYAHELTLNPAVELPAQTSAKTRASSFILSTTATT